MSSLNETEPIEISDNSSGDSCCNFEIIDKSEYLIIPSTFTAVAGFIYCIVAGPVVLTVITGIVVVSGSVAEWRVRTLGVAKQLMESVGDLKTENENLRNEIGTFKNEVENFENIVGLLGDNIEDVKDAKNQLFELYDKYKNENDRQEANNLLTLFGLVDKNQDSKLSQDEISKMKEYIKIVYKEEFDFDKLDSDDDNFVSISEFFEKFRHRKIKKIHVKKSLITSSK